MSEVPVDEKRVTLFPWQTEALGLWVDRPPKEWKRWTAWLCGTGSGKSLAGGLWLLSQQIAAAQRLAVDTGSNRTQPITLLAAPTLDSLRRNMVGPLLEQTAGTFYQPHYNENRHELRWPSAAGGGMTVCGSFDNKESIKRMEGGQYDAAAVDEATMTPESAHALLLARTAVYRGRILLLGYWYPPINWVYRKIWKPWESGALDIEVVNLPSTANPQYPREEMEAARRMLDSALFAMRYLGRPEQMVGLVYGESWDTANETIHCKPFDIPEDKDEHDRYVWRVVVGGLDQGYSPAPFHLVLAAEHPESGHLYAFAEYVSLATTTHDKAVGIAKLLYHTVPGATSRRFDFWGDPSNPQGLADLRRELANLDENRDGVPRLDIGVHPADNAVESGIEALTAAFKTGQLRIMRGRCPQLVEELGLYCRDSNGNIVKADDHGPDALRYLVYSRKRQRGRKLVYV